jgi:hypothetical protein
LLIHLLHVSDVVLVVYGALFLPVVEQSIFRVIALNSLLGVSILWIFRADLV